MKNNIEIIIKEFVAKDKIVLKNHALIRSQERKISINDIINALEECEIIKKYIDDKPLPSYLVLGRMKNKEPLHIVLAVDEVQELLWIITVYKPDEQKWDEEFKRRK